MTGAEREDEMRAAVREVLEDLVPGALGETTSAATNGHVDGNGHADGNGQADGNGHAADANLPAARAHPRDGEPTVVPQVPAPPVAAVIRPSTWSRPAAPGEVIGRAPAGQAAALAGPAQPGPRSGSARAAFKDSEFRPSAQHPSGSPPSVSPAPRASAPAEASSPAQVNPGEGRLEVVAIDTDEDLQQFIRRLMSRLENPRERLEIRTGRVRFRLQRAARGAPAATGSAGPATRVEKGAVTERMIRAAAADGARLVLAPGAVLTPLAREQAKARGVEIERERRC